MLATLGDNMPISDQTIDELDAFTCAMYGRSKVTAVDDLRHVRIKELCSKNDTILPSKNVDIGSLPPCRRSLKHHIERVNYQVYIWKQAHIPNPHIPNPDRHGWSVADEKIEPIWFEGDVLPQQLVDIADGLGNIDVNDSGSDTDEENYSSSDDD